MTDETIDNGMDRRSFIRRAGTVGAAGAMVWAAPSVTTVSRAFGQDAGSPDCATIINTFDSSITPQGRPEDARNGELTSDEKIRVWIDGDVTLTESITVEGQSGPITLTEGTRVRVYMFHSDAATGTPGQPLVGQPLGEVEFSDAILGYINDANGLLATDAWFPGTVYSNLDNSGPTWSNRRYEPEPQDVVTYESSSKLTIKTEQGGFSDQMRVFLPCTEGER